MIYLLPQIIKHAAKRFSEKEAFRFGTQSLTYGTLERQMNQLSRLLINLKVEKSDRVGIFLNRSLETAIAVYGILNAGAVFVPLDPQAPPFRIRFLLKDCSIKHLITNPAQKKALLKVFDEGIPVVEAIIGINLDLPFKTTSWEEVFQLRDTTDPAVNILESDLAYIMYTSGTTGQPKGIMHTHYSGLSYAKLSKELYGLQDQDRVGNHSPLHFDISTFGYFSAPLACATTVIVPEAHTKMPASLSLLIEQEALTVWYSVPLALSQLLHRGVLDQRDFSQLRWILFGGEPFPSKHLSRLMKLLPQAQFSNVYGPAEVNQCTYYNIPDDFEEDKPVPLGLIWNNTEMLIVDKNDQEVTLGAQGELLIRSATMMSGYWGQTDLSEKAFYEQKSASGFKKTFYRTGDLVRVDSKGNLLFLGRKDRQIKTRGYRVELDEIEAVMINHESVQEVAVYTLTTNEEEVIIEAVARLNPGDGLTEEELLNFTRRFLPWYAIPVRILFPQKIPRTPAGKIDHKLLQMQ